MEFSNGAKYSAHCAFRSWKSEDFTEQVSSPGVSVPPMRPGQAFQEKGKGNSEQMPPIVQAVVLLKHAHVVNGFPPMGKRISSLALTF